jgi:hypothetical protein
MTTLVMRKPHADRGVEKEEFEHMLGQANFSSVRIEEADLGLEITMTK